MRRSKVLLASSRGRQGHRQNCINYPPRPICIQTFTVRHQRPLVLFTNRVALPLPTLTIEVVCSSIWMTLLPAQLITVPSYLLDTYRSNDQFNESRSILWNTSLFLTHHQACSANTSYPSSITSLDLLFWSLCPIHELIGASALHVAFHGIHAQLPEP